MTRVEGGVVRLYGVAKLGKGITVPKSGSVSRHYVVFNSVTGKAARVRGFLSNTSYLTAVHYFERLNVRVRIRDSCSSIVMRKGKLRKLDTPRGVLSIKGDKAAAELVSNVLTKRPFSSGLSKSSSLGSHPVGEVVRPLARVNTGVSDVLHGKYTPLCVAPTGLRKVRCASPITDTRIGSYLLLTNLCTSNRASIARPDLSEGRARLVLGRFKTSVHSAFRVNSSGTATVIGPYRRLCKRGVAIPKSVSSTTCFVITKLVIPSSRVLMRGMKVGPAHTKVLEIYRSVNNSVALIGRHARNKRQVTSILIHADGLRKAAVRKSVVPALVSRVPIVTIVTTMTRKAAMVGSTTRLGIGRASHVRAMASGLGTVKYSIAPARSNVVVGNKGRLRNTSVRALLSRQVTVTFDVTTLITRKGAGVLSDGYMSMSCPAFCSAFRRLLWGDYSSVFRPRETRRGF